MLTYSTNIDHQDYSLFIITTMTTGSPTRAKPSSLFRRLNYKSMQMFPVINKPLTEMNNQQLPSQTKEQQQQRHLHRHFHNVPCMSILLPRRNRPHLHLNRKNTCQLSPIKTPTLYHHLVLPCIILRRTNRQKCEMTQSTKLFLLHISLLTRQDICANCWSS